MDKEKTIDIIDRLLLFSFYLLAAGLTFSNAFCEIATASIVVLWIAKKIIEKDSAIPAHRLSLLFLLFVIWNLISFINTSYINESIRGLVKVMKHGLLFLATVDFFYKPEQIKKFILFVVGVAFFISINGIIQRFIGFDLIRHNTLTPFDELHRISSSFKHSNDFGSYLIVMICILLSIFFSKSRSLRERVFIVIVSLPICGAFLATHSRGAWLGFVVALLFLTFIKSKKLFIVILIMISLSPLYLPEGIKKRFADIKTMKTEGTAWERMKLWSGTINMIRSHPVIGYGVNTYTKNFPKYKPEDYADVRYTHNSYLHMASEIGIVGAGLFIIFLATILISTKRAIYKLQDGINRDLALGLLAGTVGFLSHCFVDTHFYSVTLSAFLFLCLGLCIAFRNITLNNDLRLKTEQGLSPLAKE